MRGPYHMDCLTVGTQTLYGPLSIEDESLVPRLTHGQLKDIYERYKGAIAIIRRHREWGIWAGSTCTRQCRHAFFG